MRQVKCNQCGWRLPETGPCTVCGHERTRARGTVKLAGAKASAVHSRSGALDRPELAHDEGIAVALNQMQRTPREDFELILTTGSLHALMKLGVSRSGWCVRECVTGGAMPSTRADVAALIRRGFVEERAKGYEITDAGNDLVRGLVSFAQGFGTLALGGAAKS